MKRCILYFAVAALALAAVIGCEMTTDGPEVRSVSFDIASFMERDGEVSTKMTMTEDNKYLWQASDSVGIYPNAGSQIFFAVGSGAGTSSVSFDGGGWAFRRGYTYQSYYPFIKDFDLKRTCIPVSFTGQVQNGNNNRDHADKFVYMYTLPTSAEVGDLNFAYKHLCAVMKARVTLPKGSYSALKVSADEAIFATEGFFDLTVKTPKITPTKMSKTLNLKLTDITFSESTELVAYIFAYPAAIKGKEIKFTVFDDKGNQFSYTVTAKYDLEASWTDNFKAAEPFTDPEEPTGEGQIDDIDIEEFDWDREDQDPDVEWPKAKYPNDEADLSKDATANCYAALPGKSYSFKATVKGNSNESLDGTPVKAETLWESFNSDTAPSVGDVVKDVTFSNGRVSFTTVNEGNAVIAVKDSEETILWSWHIWVTSADLGGSCQLYYGGNVMMDRNLGALSATPGDYRALGLLYQWGRKDPFLGSSSISSDTKAKATVSEPSPVSSDATKGTIEYATSHPNTYIEYDSSNSDWYYTGDSTTDNTRWDSDKGVYDPCPPGWRVPDGGEDGVWAKAVFCSQATKWNDSTKGMIFGGKLNYPNCEPAAWYPAAGYRRSSNGSLSSVGSYGSYWSCTPFSNYYAYYLGFDNDGDVSPTNGNSRAGGRSVRCQSE